MSLFLHPCGWRVHVRVCARARARVCVCVGVFVCVCVFRMCARPRVRARTRVCLFERTRCPGAPLHVLQAVFKILLGSYPTCACCPPGHAMLDHTSPHSESAFHRWCFVYMSIAAGCYQAHLAARLTALPAQRSLRQC